MISFLTPFIAQYRLFIMVNFGEKLRANTVLEWADKYVDYKGLKDVIGDIAKQKRAMEEIEAAEIMEAGGVCWTSDGGANASERDPLLKTPEKRWRA